KTRLDIFESQTMPGVEFFKKHKPNCCLELSREETVFNKMCAIIEFLDIDDKLRHRWLEWCYDTKHPAGKLIAQLDSTTPVSRTHSTASTGRPRSAAPDKARRNPSWNNPVPPPPQPAVPAQPFLPANYFLSDVRPDAARRTILPVP